MEIILLENIINLGNIGDKVIVKPGYGRNYLLKTGKALRYSKENLEHVSKKKDEFRKEVEKNRDIFPFFMIMGFTNGMMMGTMMAHMNMNYQMMMQGMDYSYVDGSEGALPADGGFSDGGGDSGGFMDAGFQPGF